MAQAPITASVGHSTLDDPASAGKEAAERAVERLGLLQPKLAVVFASSWLDAPTLIQSIRSVLTDVPLIGGSTAGEIVAEGPQNHSCALLLLAGDGLVCGVGSGENADLSPREAGQQAAHLAAQQLKGQRRAGFLMIGDGLISGYSEVIRGLQESLGTGTLIVGATAGDDLQFKSTTQVINERALTKSVVGALFGGQASFGIGLEHGFFPISKPHQITKAKANILYELDGLPAASVYEEYFGSEAMKRMRNERLTRASVAFPLGIQQGTAPTRWILRNVFTFRDDGSLLCNAELLENTPVQLMIGSRQLAIDAAYRAAKQAVQSLNRVACVIIFDDAARRTLLGNQYAALECERMRDAIGPNTPLIGCYTYGEHAALGATSGLERTTIQTGSVLAIALGT